MKNMPWITVAYSVILVLIGLSGYFYSDQQSKTALIPAFFAIPVVICAIVGMREKFLKHAMHGAATLGLLAIFATVKGLFKLPAFLNGEELERPLAVLSQSAMCVASLIFVGLCVMSFICVRRARSKK